ncbi:MULTISPECIES: hypothetical protein [unclassified Streptomyces]|uniref:hypothetical protein n=1 Tax=unclassified Streptomyces TaxID=2593676 RepID=UPI0018E99372|nr:hypothetical protein [Streptomyces sp. TSRI0281]
MSTPEQPSFEDALARAREAAPELAAVLDEPSWEPVWKQPRTPKSKAAEKQELRKQRRRLPDAGRRRLASVRSSRADRFSSRAVRGLTSVDSGWWTTSPP